jgi:hypothetical protein
MGIRQRIDAFYEWDERVHRQLSLSRTVSVLVLLTIFVCSGIMVRVVWSIRPEPDVQTMALAAGVFVAWAATVLIRRRMHEQLAEQRRIAGCCIQCGYDVRENPYYCPECGHSN